MKIRFFYRSLNMQTRELDHATIAVANTNISGTATADKIKRGLRSEKKRRQWRISGLPGLGSLMATGIFVALTLLPARAGQGGVPAEIAVLQAQVTALQDQVKTLQTANTDQQNEINGLKASDATLQKQLAAVKSNHALLLGPFVSVVSAVVDGVNGPHIYFTGANIHIVSGSGSTFDNFNVTGNFTPTGLGNLIIGYNEDPVVRGGFPLAPGDRGGSHNLVVGTGNRFTKAALGGFVAGGLNTISNLETSVSGGAINTASGGGASVSGGFSNTASGFQAIVSGGGGNTASGHWESILGGFDNLASGNFAIVVGGENNTASGDNAVVLGSTNVTATANSIAPQPPFP
jgi:hypothetical protein